VDGTSAVTYRRAAADDRERILEVLASANFHHIPSPEMPELDLERFLVAEIDDRIVGVAGWKVLADGEGKTTLMAVLPSARGHGIGMELQRRRMRLLHEAGCHYVTTNADLPATIAWYQRHFSYEQVGTLPKEHSFGAEDIDHWTTLRADIDAWLRRTAAHEGQRPSV
jgi:N-acetylglutamate synthase-like GNAT family acetyltransferase